MKASELRTDVLWQPWGFATEETGQLGFPVERFEQRGDKIAVFVNLDVALAVAKAYDHCVADSWGRMTDGSAFSKYHAQTRRFAFYDCDNSLEWKWSEPITHDELVMLPEAWSYNLAPSDARFIPAADMPGQIDGLTKDLKRRLDATRSAPDQAQSLSI